MQSQQEPKPLPGDGVRTESVYLNKCRASHTVESSIHVFIISTIAESDVAIGSLVSSSSRNNEPSFRTVRILVWLGKVPLDRDRDGRKRRYTQNEFGDPLGILP